MKKKLIIPQQIVTADEHHRILTGNGVEIAGDKITSIRKFDLKEINDFDGEVIVAENLTLIPGFIQTHIHLCQTLFRGLADELELLDWLKLRIFPFENALDKNSLRFSAQLGINELQRGGTTTIMDMGTLNFQEIIFDELISSGMRAFAGKCMIDLNDLYPAFKAETKDELRRSYELAESFHNKEDGRIKYAFAPRFVLSCTEKLLRETKEMMSEFDGSIFHTHSSESKGEVEEVRKRFKKENIEYFDSINTLDDYSVLAHGIHVNDNEIEILKNRDVRIAHCPSSNLKLASGIANIPRFLDEGISVSIGADGAPCNNKLSAFAEMRLAALIQKPFRGVNSIDAPTIFRMATIEGARALHIDDEVGSIEEGKKADMVLIDLDNQFSSLLKNEESIYSDIVYTATRENIMHVMIDGRWVVKDGVSLHYDEHRMLRDARLELAKLLGRI